MADLGAWAGWVGTIIGAILLVGTLAAVVRANLAKAQVEALRGDRDDLLKRVEILERDRAADKAAHDSVARDLAEERRARQVLERVVTGREQLDQITTLLLQHDQRVDGIRQTIENGMARVEVMHTEHENSAEERAKATRARVAEAERNLIRAYSNSKDH